MFFVFITQKNGIHFINRDKSGIPGLY